MEEKIKAVLNAFPDVLMNKNVQIYIQPTFLGFFVKFRIKDEMTNGVLLWSAIKVGDESALGIVEFYLKFLQETFV